jgi:hypothetical protein
MKQPNRWFTPLGLSLFFLLCLVPAGHAQGPPCVQLTPSTSAFQLGQKCIFTSASSPVSGFAVSGLTYWQVYFVPSGTVSGATLSLDSSATGLSGSWSTGGVIAAASIGAMTSPGSYNTATAATPTNFMQLTPTITGSGQVTVIIFGYTNNPGASGSASSTIVSPVDGSGYIEVNCKTGCTGTTLGQTTMSASLPVAIASNQSSIPVAATQSGTWNVAQSGTWSVTATQATGSNLHVVCDSGCSGTTLGQTTMSASLPVAIASNQSTVPVSLATAPTTPTQPSGFGTLIGFQQAVTASAVALATNSSHTFCVQALPANTINIYVGPSGVTTSTGLPLAPGATACWPLSNTNLVYVIASTTGASVAVTGT